MSSLSRTKVDILVRQIREKEELLAEELRILRKECLHLNIVECDSKRYKDFVPEPVIRLCVDCGIEEEDEGSFWNVLTAEPIKIGRDDLFQKRIKGIAAKYSWCYGNRKTRGHSVPKGMLRYDGETRCCPEHCRSF